MALPPQFLHKSPGQQAVDRSGGASKPPADKNDVTSLRNAIGSFISQHGGDKRFDNAIASLRSAQAELKRVGGQSTDAGPPSPGRMAAMNAKGTPSQ